MQTQAQFNETLKAKLQAAGFSAAEITCAALVAESRAATALIQNPLAAAAVSDTFAKVLALWAMEKNVDAERSCAAADIIAAAGLAYAQELLDADEQPSVRRMAVDLLDDTAATNPKDIN